MSSENDFVRGLVVAVPTLRPLYQEHLDFYDELLPHVFFGDVSRFFEAAWGSATDGSKTNADVDAILGYMKEGMRTGSPEVMNLIEVSFYENLESSIGDVS